MKCTFRMWWKWNACSMVLVKGFSDSVQALKMFLQDSAKAALHSLHCQLALWRGWGPGARGLWKSSAEGGYNETSLKAKLWPTQITQVRLMKDEGGRLRGYGYADFEDRDSLVSFNYVCVLFVATKKSKYQPDWRPLHDWPGCQQPQDEDRSSEPGFQKMELREKVFCHWLRFIFSF